MEAHLAEDCPEQIVDCVLASCGCKARPKRCEQLEHQQLAAESHAELCAAQAERLRLAEARGTSQARLLAATDSWVLDEDQGEATLKKIRSEALTESGRVELADRGALQARARILDTNMPRAILGAQLGLTPPPSPLLCSSSWA